MKHDNLKDRTKSFALRVIRMVEGLPKYKTTDVIGRQLLRSGTSVGANYRAAAGPSLQLILYRKWARLSGGNR